LTIANDIYLRYHVVMFVSRRRHHVLGLGFLAALLASIASAADYNVAFANAKGIFVMTSAGRAVKRIAGDTQAILTRHSWSPDGQKIMFFTFRAGDEEIGKKVNIPFHFPLYVMNADGSNAVRLLDVPVMPDAVWSPDAKSIAVTSEFEGGAIYVVDVQSRTMRRLTQIAHPYSPAWSPDGKRIAFNAATAKTSDIFVIDADGKNQTQLTNLGRIARNAAWSPDGSKIAFIANDGWFVMDADGGNKKHRRAQAVSNIEWSPDGKRVLVSGFGFAYVCDPDGTNSAALPRQRGPVLDPVFSPDGRRVIYRVHEGKADKIYTVSADGSDWRTLNDNVGEHVLFAVSP
jgi:Tol biopolymer transport system component